MTCSQSNTDSDFFQLFMYHFVKLLDEEQRDWRKDTIILLDNAGYHSSDSTRDMLEKLRVPTVYLGPYAFDSSVVEAFFSYFK